MHSLPNMLFRIAVTMDTRAWHGRGAHNKVGFCTGVLSDYSGYYTGSSLIYGEVAKILPLNLYRSHNVADALGHGLEMPATFPSE